MRANRVRPAGEAAARGRRKYEWVLSKMDVCPLPLAAPPRVRASRVTDGAYNSKKVKKATATVQEPTFKSVASEGGTEMEAKS